MKAARASAPGAFSPAHFDDAYFDKFYGSDPRQRVHGPKEVGHLARGIAGFAGYWGIPLRSALDIGAGPGLWRDALVHERPNLKYQGVDVSPYACERYGHLRRDVATWRSKRRYDLIICQGVMQYLDDDGVTSAIENIAAMCSGLLYFEALTKHDVAEVIDVARSDAAVNLRTGAFYRKRLGEHFINVGCGIFCARRAGAVFFELETAEQ